jgi:hypothetical protein
VRLIQDIFQENQSEPDVVPAGWAEQGALPGAVRPPGWAGRPAASGSFKAVFREIKTNTSSAGAKSAAREPDRAFLDALARTQARYPFRPRRLLPDDPPRPSPAPTRAGDDHQPNHAAPDRGPHSALSPPSSPRRPRRAGKPEGDVAPFSRALGHLGKSLPTSTSRRRGGRAKVGSTVKRPLGSGLSGPSPATTPAAIATPPATPPRPIRATS